MRAPWHGTEDRDGRADNAVRSEPARPAEIDRGGRRGRRDHGRLAAEAGGDIAAAEADAAAPDAVESGADAGFGLPVGASVPADTAGWLATTEADGSEGSDAGAVGTRGSGALAGTTMAVGAGASDCLLQAPRAISAATVPHITHRFIRFSRVAIERRLDPA
jgi:hypothetical protein